jgi:hypothetical protein
MQSISKMPQDGVIPGVLSFAPKRRQKKNRGTCDVVTASPVVVQVRSEKEQALNTLGPQESYSDDRF